MMMPMSMNDTSFPVIDAIDHRERRFDIANRLTIFSLFMPEDYHRRLIIVNKIFEII